MKLRILTLRGLIVSITMLLSTSHAFSQDSFDLSGWYAGAFGAYLSGELTSDDPSHFESTGDFNDDGPMAGIFGGYNHTFDNDWLAGGELILPLYMQKGTAVDKVWFPDTVTYEASYNFGIFISGKWGRSLGKSLPYAYGAIGITSVNGSTYNVDLEENYSPGFVQESTATHFVWQIGVGFDYLIIEKLILSGRVGAFIGSKADHTVPWNEPGPNMFGYKSVIFQLNVAYKFKSK